MQQYTVRSRGVPIGVTDLGFTRIEGTTRVGWFQPNADGERVMAIVGAVLPLMRASARREVRDGSPLIVLSLEVEGPELPPELLSAMHEVETLELTLHGADGSVIPTESIAFQDVEQLRALFGPDDAELEAECARWDEGLDDETREAIERDVAAVLEEAGFAQREPWMPEEEPAELGPYQVFVRLISEWDVP
jgi:hypothetical protein